MTKILKFPNKKPLDYPDINKSYDDIMKKMIENYLKRLKATWFVYGVFTGLIANLLLCFGFILFGKIN